MKNRRSCCCVVLLLVAVLLAALTVLLLLWRARCQGDNLFPEAAVAADSQRCSEIGRNILLDGGSAVDGAIAALLCTSLVNPQSIGIGGGAIFTIYNASTGRVTVINARETAPQNLKPETFTGCGSFPKPGPGSQWIAVPGELRGYEEAHQKFGKLPWKSLFEPSIKLAEHGFQFPEYLKRVVSHRMFREQLKKSSLSSLFYKDDHLLKNVTYPQLAETLKVIAEEGPDAFYSGKIAQNLIRDIQAVNDSGSFITLQDLKQYRVSVTEPLTISLGDYTMYTPPLPSRGAILSFILNVLKGFKFTPESMGRRRKVQTYHRIIEALKFGNGQLSKMIDQRHHSYVSELLSDQFANFIQQRIDDQVHEPEYYHTGLQALDKYGTSHVSAIDRDGNAVAVTSSINYPFGSMVFSSSTGIILNNQMADFCRADGTFPDIKTVAGQQPPSSMTPSILISQDKESVMVMGASGGSMIISATAQVSVSLTASSL
ncbi:glutathione hydrolase 5 proenzyme-like [Mustelus asterias]